MKYKIEITDIKPGSGFETWEGKWAASDENGDDITYLVSAAIPHAIREKLDQAAQDEGY